MVGFPEKLREKLRKRADENAMRSLDSSRELIDFSSNDYLGFARNNAIGRNAEKFLEHNGFYQNGSTGSRLLSGNHPLYQELETFLANYHGFESALVFNSGYMANIGLFSSVPQRGDIIFYDELCHASIRDGITMGNAKSYKFSHNDLDDLKKKFDNSLKAKSRSDDAEIFIVTESVFSMDGDSPDLVTLAELCRETGVHLIVDEAHALGVFNRGLVNELGLQDHIFAQIITFGKALGAHGAAILGSMELKKYLINFCRSFIYTTALPPHTLATIIEAYRFLDGQEGLGAKARLQQNIVYFWQQIRKLGLQHVFLESKSTIQIVVMGEIDKAKTCAAVLQENGLDVRPILSPTVPKGRERLRICLHAFNTKKEINQLLNVIAGYWHGE